MIIRRWLMNARNMVANWRAHHSLPSPADWLTFGPPRVLSIAIHSLLLCLFGHHYTCPADHLRVLLRRQAAGTRLPSSLRQRQRRRRQPSRLTIKRECPRRPAPKLKERLTNTANFHRSSSLSLCGKGNDSCNDNGGMANVQ